LSYFWINKLRSVEQKEEIGSGKWEGRPQFSTAQFSIINKFSLINFHQQSKRERRRS